MHDVTQIEQEPTPTYYDRPLLKAPHWEWNVVTYLFLGGIMGGLGLIQVLADEKKPEEKKLKRTVHITSFALAAINPGILITHLGKPERFLNMLRIVKFKSPMSMGVWGLVLYSGAAGANVIGFTPALAQPAQMLLGAFTAGYTGVLLSATANPLWASGKRHIPAFSVASGLASACALSSLLSVATGNDKVLHKIERLEMVAGVAEFALLADFKRHSGNYGKPLFEGKHADTLRNVTMIAGIAVPFALNLLGSVVKLPKPVNVLRTAVASVLTLAGGYALRHSLIEAGKDSARDPRAATIQPK